MFVLFLPFSITQESVLELDFIANAHMLYPDTKRYEKGVFGKEYLITVNISCYSNS